MIKRPAKQPALCAIPEIEPLGQGYITIVVRISIPIVVGSLPTEEFIVLRVTFLFCQAVNSSSGNGGQRS